jgi:hypothetical protein
MTNYKSLSGLSIAAIALLATAAPCFSQGQSDHSASNTQNVQTVAIEQTVASNREMTVPTNSRFAKPVPTTRPVTLSASNFEVKSQFMAPTNSRFTNQINLDPAATDDLSGKKQYRSDDQDASATSTKNITFVPSRGQKIPQ